jgi:RHS repeat-associated protein
LRSRYDAYGNAISQPSSVSNKYLFAGEQFDANLSDYYLRDRYYDNNTGRFTRQDTYEGEVETPLSLHKYIYAHDNPVTYTDPSGFFITLGEVNAAQTISDTLQRQRDNLQLQSLRRFVAKDHELFAVFHIIFRRMTPHAFMYAKNPRLAASGLVARFDVGAENTLEALRRPFSTVAGGLQERLERENNLPKIAVKRSVAKLNIVQYNVWKVAIRAIPSSEGYQLYGQNCITWTITAAALAKALEHSA